VPVGVHRAADVGMMASCGPSVPPFRMPSSFDKFAIGFDHRDRARVHALWDEVFDSEQWSHGEMNRRFEEAWAAWNGAPAVAFAGWSGGALAALSFADVRGQAVLCPSNTFMATPLAIIAAGGRPVFVDCNRDDLCLSLADLEAKIARHRPKACVLVHIGGHLAFQSEQIAAVCREAGVFLLEDCAHAHGASWHGRKAGTFGDAGVFSLYATKTISTGEGGVLVSRRPDVIEFARAYRDYGKPDYAVHGLNFRMSEFVAALGLAQVERLDEIVAWKNEVARTRLDPRHPGRLQLPDGMVSGLYKYVVFDAIERSTGKVYDEPCHRIMGTGDDLPNSDWVAGHHWCVPLYYRPEVAMPERSAA
jgi:perosamine synthetase